LETCRNNSESLREELLLTEADSNYGLHGIEEFAFSHNYLDDGEGKEWLKTACKFISRVTNKTIRIDKDYRYDGYDFEDGYIYTFEEVRDTSTSDDSESEMGFAL